MTAGSSQAGKSAELTRIIVDLQQAIPDLEGVMIASVDGLAIAHDFPEEDADRIAAMAATALGLGARIADRTNLGELAEAVIRGEHGYLVVYDAGETAVLVLLGPLDSNLGLMRIEARVAAVEIKQVLGAP